MLKFGILVENAKDLPSDSFLAIFAKEMVTQRRLHCGLGVFVEFHVSVSERFFLFFYASVPKGGEVGGLMDFVTKHKTKQRETN